MSDEHDAVIHRLRRLGAEQPPEGMFDHRNVVLVADGSRRRSHLTATGVFAAIVTLVAAGAWGVATTNGGPGPSLRTPGVEQSVPGTRATTVPADPAAPVEPFEGTPVDPFRDDPCKGPPPFAGRAPQPAGEDGGAARHADSEAWQQLKEDCPDDEGEARACIGPPPKPSRCED